MEAVAEADEGDEEAGEEVIEVIGDIKVDEGLDNDRKKKTIFNGIIGNDFGERGKLVHFH